MGMAEAVEEFSLMAQVPLLAQDRMRPLYKLAAAALVTARGLEAGVTLTGIPGLCMSNGAKLIIGSR